MSRSKVQTKLVNLLLVALAVTSLVGCSPNRPNDTDAKEAATAKVEVTVSAAASLQNVLNELTESYQKANPAVTIKANYAGSSTLQKQIEQGAPVDLFISASGEQMYELEAQQLVDVDTRSYFLTNELVLIVPKQAKEQSPIKGLADLPKAKLIAIGEPRSVPAGTYARDALGSLGLYEQVEQGKKLSYGKDVRQVLTYVETGDVDAGIVYKTDALQSDKVEVVATLPSDGHKPIVYPMAVVSASKQKQAAKALIQYLQSKEAQDVFLTHGFKMVK